MRQVADAFVAAITSENLSGSDDSRGTALRCGWPWIRAYFVSSSSGFVTDEWQRWVYNRPLRMSRQRGVRPGTIRQI